MYEAQASGNSMAKISSPTWVLMITLAMCSTISLLEAKSIKSPILTVQDLIRQSFQIRSRSDDLTDLSIRAEPSNLRIMSFNTWNTGANVKDGLTKVASYILQLNPDIVALQEVETDVVWTQLLKYLGPQWSGMRRNGSYPDSAMVTRHQIDPDSCNQTGWAVGCRLSIRSGNQSKHNFPGDRTPHAGSYPLHFWSVHLDWRNYGPTAACNKKVTDPIQIEAGEYNLGSPKTPGRAQNMIELTTNPAFQSQLAQTDTVPMFVVGDFNSPSHLDWVDATKSSHCGWAFSYPATRILDRGMNFTDSYRMLHPDPEKDPGITWSTVQIHSDGWGYTIPEPQDRIDYIHFRSPNVQPISVEPFKGAGHVLPKPFTELNDWPSDHYGVVGDFKVGGN